VLKMVGEDMKKDVLYGMFKMKRLFTLPVVVALLSGCSQASAPVGRAVDETAIRQLLADSEKNFAARDFDKVMKFYANDAVVLLPDRPMLKGTAAIKAAMQDAFGGPNISVAVRPDSFEVASSGDLAYGYGTGTSTITDPKTRSVATAQSKWVTVFRKQPGGSWQAVADIYNSDGPPAPAVQQ
jgi:uncharacterized protein (TIGR02246 family)